MVGVSEPEYNIKGTATIVSREWVDERLGEGWFHKTITKQYPDWPTRLLPGEYYPLRPQMAMWHVAQTKIEGYDGVEELVQEAAGATAERDLTSIYTAFLWVASPQMFMRAVPRLWASYVRFGELQTLENSAGLYRARISGVPNDLLDWAAGSVAGFLRPALLLAGGKDPDSQVVDRRPGESKKIWEFEYRLAYE